MYTRTLCFLFFLSLGTQICKAQLPIPRVSDFKGFSGYSNQTAITDVKTDSKGNIWIVEFGGVTKFDGHTFHQLITTKTPHANFIRFYETLGGRPFLTDYHGSIFFIQSDTIVPYQYNDTLKKLNPGHYTTDIFFDERERLHVSFQPTGYRIIESDGTVLAPLEHYQFSKTENFVAVLRTNKVPFLAIERRVKQPTHISLVFNLMNENLELLDTIHLSEPKSRFPQSVVTLSNNNYLLSTGWGHLIEFNDSQIVKKHQFQHTSVQLFVDSKGGLWIATLKNGLHYYSNGQIEEENIRRLFEEDFAIAATEDYEGGIWIHTDAHGLSYISRPRESYYKMENGHILGNYVNQLSLMKGRLYAPTEDGTITILNPRTQESQHIPNPIQIGKSTDYLICDSLKNRIWLAERGKIHYSDNGGWKLLDHSSLKKVIPTSRFRMYNRRYESSPIACTHGNEVFLIDDTTITYVSPTFPDPLHGIIHHNDSIWGIGKGKLYQLVSDEIQDLSSVFTQLKNRHIQSIEHFGKALWVVTNTQEIYTLNNGELRRVFFDGSPLVGGIFHHANPKHLWILSHVGSFLVEKKPKTIGHPWTISAYQPFQSAPLSRIKSNRSTMYWGTPDNGIMAIKFDDLKNAPLQGIRIHLSQLQINKEVVPIRNTVYDIPYEKNFVEITYQGLSFQSINLNYRYRLIGLEVDWTLTKQLSIQYTTLPAGDYTFEVQARRVNGFWSDSKTLHFKVAPPYWETWWFITGCSVLALLIAFVIGSIRIRVIRREQQLVINGLKAEQNALQAQMDPHFVFNILASVQYLILDSTKERVITFLNMFSRSLRNTLDQTRKNSLPLKSEIQFLREYIEMERFRLEDKFDFDIQEPQTSFLELKIPPFIIQPFVENAIQHGLKNKLGQGHLSLTFAMEGDFIKVIITDDGVGRKAAGRFKKENGSHNGKSHGVDIISKRLSLYNNHKENVLITDLTDTKGEALGTQVLIFIKRKDHESTHH